VLCLFGFVIVFNDIFSSNTLLLIIELGVLLWHDEVLVLLEHVCANILISDTSRRLGFD
jgi:hypothetical protein